MTVIINHTDKELIFFHTLESALERLSELNDLGYRETDVLLGECGELCLVVEKKGEKINVI